MREIPGQDKLTDKLKDEYYREAAHYLNVAERVGAESGEAVSGTLAFLTRGVSSCSARYLILFIIFQAYNNLQPVPWTTPSGPSMAFWQKNPPMWWLCWARYVLLFHWVCQLIHHRLVSFTPAEITRNHFGHSKTSYDITRLVYPILVSALDSAFGRWTIRQKQKQLGNEA